MFEKSDILEHKKLLAVWTDYILAGNLASEGILCRVQEHLVMVTIIMVLQILGNKYAKMSCTTASAS